jgi:predicted AlkP superfamily phosphohydrolase/phosphomutase
MKLALLLEQSFYTNYMHDIERKYSFFWQDFNIVNILIDEKTNQYFGKKVEMELSIKERKRLLNQLTEPEKTELQEQILKEDELKEQVKDIIQSADIIVFHRTKQKTFNL